MDKNSGFWLAPIEPNPSVLRGFINCPPEELPLAWEVAQLVTQRLTPPTVAQQVHLLRSMATDKMIAAGAEVLRTTPINNSFENVALQCWLAMDAVARGWK